jgi:hypothetical protein
MNRHHDPRLSIISGPLATIRVGLAMLSALVLAASPLAAAERVDFNRDILPILSDNCFQCHGPDAKARKAKLRLDAKEGALRAQDPIIVPGHSAESKLIQRVTNPDDNERMPPPKAKRRLTQQQCDLLRRWVDEGAAWGKHWAFVAPVRPALPVLRNTAWARNAIDAFILARLEHEGLTPSSEAAKETLLRRVSLDLTGLPPSLNDIDAFVNDPAPDAYEKVVDRLLASPAYGERMAWDWLDAARYADTNGYQGDPERTMWPWRDWVVQALNANMPYDQFTIEQLAGDLLADATLSQKIATGFNRNHMHNGEGGRIPEETRVENVMDRVETTATVWLGTTIGCTRCHDHKFDPFTQKEYYQLFAYFNNTSDDGQGHWNGRVPPLVDFITPADQARLTELRQRVPAMAARVDAAEKERFAPAPGKYGGESPKAAGLPAKIQDHLKRPPQDRPTAALDELAAHFEKSDPPLRKLLMELKQATEERDRFTNGLPRVMVMDELSKPRQAFVLVRGAYDKPGESVGPGTPAILPALPAQAPKNRLALARWLVDLAHPLTTRVTVNRFWQMFFGTGLVKTVEDFGVQGERPSHPELLDWLATELVASGWNVKQLQRLIVTSAAYRQSSKVTPQLLERDPGNRLLARGPRYRLPAWMIRDQALAAAGLLCSKMTGPSVKPYQPAGLWEEATFGQKSYKQDKGDSLYRRSLYTFWRRIVGPPEFFDNTARQTCTVKVVRTNTPLQALTTLNDVTYVEAARALAQRVLETAATPRERIQTAFRLVSARRPTAQEELVLIDALELLEADYRADPQAATKLLQVGEAARNPQLPAIDHAAYTALCSLLLNLDETLTKQ